ncbi:DJ-1/PfpI family protein [Pandoraea pnomenusa]|uniref:DJ-1/PfpI family protein n=1 Tax=Pandoraea pnomenusa TaxID=93220 RepID=UPI00333EFF90
MRLLHSLVLVSLVMIQSVPSSAAPDPAGGDIALSVRQDLLDALGKRPRDPVIAVLALNEGTETTDFLVPYGVLKRAGAGHVEAVAVGIGDVTLMPALRIVPDTTLAAFDARHPRGADIVIVPAMHTDDDPRVIRWLQHQAGNGALIVGICSGARVLSRAGLLKHRAFTGHWYDRDDLRRANPNGHYVPDVRYLHDNGVVTTTGVSASLPLALALVEGIAGRERAEHVADELGVTDVTAHHLSAGFALNARRLWTISRNWAAFWRHETVAIPVIDGADDVSVALVTDAWSRTWRSQAVAVSSNASSGRVRMASGLTLIAQDGRTPVADHVVPLTPSVTAVERFTQTLDAIARRYGDAERDIVTLALEYRDASR